MPPLPRFVFAAASLAFLLGAIVARTAEPAPAADLESPAAATDDAWETPATINRTWGFRSDDTDWKSPSELVFKLVDIVSKGGN